jgi:hypothetical protein
MPLQTAFKPLQTVRNRSEPGSSNPTSNPVQTPFKPIATHTPYNPLWCVCTPEGDAPPLRACRAAQAEALTVFPTKMIRPA